MRASASGDVALFLGKKRVMGSAPVEMELPEKEWSSAVRPLVEDSDKKRAKGSTGGEGDGKGSWVQRATFRSVFKLNCPPAFAVHNIECSVRLTFACVLPWGLEFAKYDGLTHSASQYDLVVRVPFPGIGNSLKLEVPVKVTSGIDKPFAKDESDSDSTPPPLDLPP